MIIFDKFVYCKKGENKMCRKSGSFSPISYRWLKKSYFGMFYVRTTLGCISIIIADAFICALVSWVTLSRILCTHDRYNVGGLLDNVPINIISLTAYLLDSGNVYNMCLQNTYPASIFLVARMAYRLS